MLKENIYFIILFPFIMILAIFLSKQLNLVDKPNFRKIHNSNIANTSGLILGSYLLIYISYYEFSNSVEVIIANSFLVVLIGFWDDLKNFQPTTKFTLLSLPIFYQIFNGLYLVDIGTYENIGTLKLGKFYFIFTFFAVSLLVNAINYIDGTDGLLIGFAIIAISYFYFLSDAQSPYLPIFQLIISCLFICLFFNFLPIKSGFKCFLGDGGSLFLGFFISFIMIFLYKDVKIQPAYLIWACWYPVYDFLFVTFYRLKNKINFAVPDKSHLHHDIFYFCLKNHWKTFIIINLLNITILTIGYFICLLLGNIYSIALFIILFLFFCIFRIRFKKNINGLFSKIKK